jgi:hypothetical protein
LALAELTAAWNCRLQSEKAMWAAGSLGAELAEVVPAPVLAAEPPPELAPELAVVAGAVGRLVEVQAALASSATPAASAERRVTRRVDCTRRG